MTTTVKTWGHDVNNLVSSSLTQTQQYQELFFALHSAIRNAGHTVIYSSNGVTASAADNINSTADVVIDSSSSARSWALYEFAPAAQNKGQFTIIAEDSATSAPQDFRVSFSATPFDTTGLSVTSPPAKSSVNNNGFVELQFSILRDWTTPENGIWHAIWSDRGDVIFFAKRETSDANDFEWFLRCDDPAEAGAGTEEDLCCFVYSNPASFVNSGVGAGDSVSTKAIHYYNFNDDLNGPRWAVGGPGGWRNNVGFNNTAWVDGLDSAGRLHVFDIELYVATAPGRWLGKWVDVKGCSVRAPRGAVEAGDTDPIRYAHVSGGVMLPWPAAEFPIL